MMIPGPPREMLWVIPINGKTMEMSRCWSSIDNGIVCIFLSASNRYVAVRVRLYVSSNKITAKEQRQDGTSSFFCSFSIYRLSDPQVPQQCFED